MSILVEINDDSDGEYHDLEDAGEAVQDGAEAAAQLLAETEPEAGVENDLDGTPAPAAGDVMSVTSSAIKAARQPQPARLAATRALQYDLPSQHTPSKNEVHRISAGQTEIPNLETLSSRLQELHNLNWDDLSDIERGELNREQGVLLGAMAPAPSGHDTRTSRRLPACSPKRTMLVASSRPD
jgi:hypothetical protein